MQKIWKRAQILSFKRKIRYFAIPLMLDGHILLNITILFMLYSISPSQKRPSTRLCELLSVFDDCIRRINKFLFLRPLYDINKIFMNFFFLHYNTLHSFIEQVMTIRHTVHSSMINRWRQFLCKTIPTYITEWHWRDLSFVSHALTSDDDLQDWFLLN